MWVRRVSQAAVASLLAGAIARGDQPEEHPLHSLAAAALGQ
jgi:hypothetical protein